MHKLLIATSNPGKLKEISNFLSGLKIKTLSLKDIGITDDVEENGSTYSENSLIKAKFYMEKSGLPTISDDGGIEISALGNAPGVKSKRWIGENATDEDLIEHMKRIAKELPDNNRTAWFRTVITFALPNGLVYQVEGEVEGIIARKSNLKYLEGYPYRSFFFLPQINKYYHENELSKEEMKIYNHRYKAISKLLPIIKKELK